MKNSQKALDTLRLTDDGNTLSPKDLKLLEHAVNNNLNELGETLFAELHERVTSGNYDAGCLFDIKFLTEDHEGYVYWKGIEIEHFSHSNPNEKHKAALELERKCKHIEAIGSQVCQRNVVWYWGVLKDLSPDNAWVHFLSQQLAIYESDCELLFINNDRVIVFNRDGHKSAFESIAKFAEARNDSNVEESLYILMSKLGFHIPMLGQEEGLGVCYGNSTNFIAKFKDFHVPHDLFS